MLHLEQATIQDLPRINEIIEAAIMQWHLPERVKRLSLSSYRYNEFDLQQYVILLAKTAGEIVGIISYEQTESKDVIIANNALSIHGIYVAPDFQRKGVGTFLIHAAENIARHLGLNSIEVKAQKDAIPFYTKNNFFQIQTTNAGTEYPARYLKSLNS